MTTTTENLEISIAGMTCGHYAERVTSALKAVPGVESASVDLAQARAIVTVDPARPIARPW